MMKRTRNSRRRSSANAGPPTFYHGDLTRSTLMTTDESASVLTQVAYTAFGEIVLPDGQGGWTVGGEAPAGHPRYGYDGGWGYESGMITLWGDDPTLPPIVLQHVGERWYQPDTGRFVQRDPIAIFGGLNVYAYCQANPLTGVDPLGLLAWYDAVIWLTGGDESWLDDADTVRTAQGVFFGIGVGAAAGAGVCYAVGFNPWLGKIARHGAHGGGPHTWPHLQFMIRTGAHTTKHFRIRILR